MLSVILESYDLPATSGFAKVSAQILSNLERTRRGRNHSMADTELRGESRERLDVETVMVGSGRSGSSLEHRSEDLARDGKWRGRLPARPNRGRLWAYF